MEQIILGNRYIWLIKRERRLSAYVRKAVSHKGEAARLLTPEISSESVAFEADFYDARRAFIAPKDRFFQWLYFPPLPERYDSGRNASHPGTT